MCNGRLLAVQGNRGMKLHCGVSGKKNYFRCTKSQQTLLDLTLFCCIQPLLRLLNRDLTVCMDVNKNPLFIRFVHYQSEGMDAKCGNHTAWGNYKNSSCFNQYASLPGVSMPWADISHCEVGSITLSL